LPDDPGHLVAVHFDDGILHLDLRHSIAPLSEIPALVGLSPTAKERSQSRYCGLSRGPSTGYWS
jgi:hypothetical protein